MDTVSPFPGGKHGLAKLYLASLCGLRFNPIDESDV